MEVSGVQEHGCGMRIRFLSGNPFKIEEATSILGQVGVQVIPVEFVLTELQTDDTVGLVRDKTLKAFYRLGHKVFVEQTGLFIDRMQGLPGGLTQVFWDKLGPDRVCELFGHGKEVGVTAKTRIGYCDGRDIHQFEGEIRGTFTREPRGDRKFQWDCVFMPDGHDETFAEMGERKNDISMRRRALDAFAAHLVHAAHA